MKTDNIDCEFCRTQMCAKTDKQLQLRLYQMERYPQVLTAPCPKCGGTAWARSRKMIEGTQQSWWRRWLGLRESWR